MDMLALVLVAIGFAIFISGLNRIPSIPRVRDSIISGQKTGNKESTKNSQSFKLLTRPELNLTYRARIGMKWLSKPAPVLTLLISFLIMSALNAIYAFAPPLLIEILIGSVLCFVFFSGPHRLYNIEYYLSEIWKLSSDFISEIDRRIVDRTTRDYTKWIIAQILCGLMLVTIAVQPIEFILSTAWIVALVSMSIVVFGFVISKYTFSWIEHLILQDGEIRAN